MIAAMLTFVSLSYANGNIEAKDTETSVFVDIKLQQAVQDPVLLEAMVNQLTPGSLEMNEKGYYNAEVVIGNTTYVITGTQKGWKRFFSMGLFGSLDIKS